MVPLRVRRALARARGFLGADYCKVLVRDNPGLDTLQRGQQAHRLAQVSSWAAEHGRPLILELLVPATDSDKAAVGGDTVRYDAEVRPRHTLDIIRYLPRLPAGPGVQLTCGRR